MLPASGHIRGTHPWRRGGSVVFDESHPQIQRAGSEPIWNSDDQRSADAARGSASMAKEV